MNSINKIEDLKSIMLLQQDVATSHQGLDSLMNLICERTEKITNAVGAVVELVDGEDMVYKAATGILAKTVGLRLKLASSLSGLSVKSGEVLYCKDSEIDERVDRAACRRLNIRSMICVPLVHNKINIGVLKVVATETSKFSDREISILRVVTGLLSAYMSQAIEENEKQKALKELIDNERKFRTLFDSSNDVIMISKNGICLEVNPLFTEVFEYTTEEIVGHSVFKIVCAEDLDKTKNNIAAKFGGTYEIKCCTKTGKVIEIEATGRTLRYNDEEIRVTTIRNITEQKIAQRAQLEAMEAKTRFIANMSHEIRTPLNGILGMASLIEETDLSQEQRKYVNILKNSADNLLTIVNDILDFSKVEAKKIEIEKIPFSLIGCVEEIRQILSFGSSKKGLVINLNHEKDLPQFVLGDPTRIRQVLMNLISNAIKFTEKGEIVIEVCERDHLIHFSVIDTGIGMNEESLKKIFLPFTQADASTTRKFGGTGLGLSICKQLIETMGGTIGVKSSEGKGSVFWFELPLEETNAPVLHQPHAPVQLNSTKLRILIAEDNDVNALIAKSVIEKLGHTTKVAHNGREAITALESEPFDLVLMDCQMPEMDGFEATKAIRASEESWKNIKIVAVTANALSGDKERCLNAGMNDYISKPFKKEELLKVLKT